ncbi:MAG: FAD-dependent oxidoreductase [Saezia sp.]
MSEDKFDAIVVGGGIAGATTALLLARAGLEVVIVERGNYAGAKNMTGGRLYSHSLEKIIPGFAEHAPIERKVVKEKISMMTKTGAVALDFSSEKLVQEKQDSYTVLRAPFDRWLIEQAEAAGVMVVTGILVEELLMQDGRVTGIRAGGEEMLANVVVLADGANSLLVEKAGLRKHKIEPHQMAVGAKEVIELGEQVIEERFNLNPGEGATWLFAGFPSNGLIGGGFLYTNKSSISLGLVVTLSEFRKAEKTLPQMLEDFKQHPHVAPLIKGGKLLEYSGHLVPEGGYDMVPDLYGDGVLVVGDAAALVINAGYTVRGMDLAVGSADAAAQAIIAAKEKNDYSSSVLAHYKSLLDKSFVLQEMKQLRKFPHFMENSRIFNDYPQMAEEMMSSLFVVNGSPPQSLISKMFKPAKKVGLMNLIKDGIKGVRAL